MRPFVESELVRTPLEEVCLQCKRVSVYCVVLIFVNNSLRSDKQGISPLSILA